MLIVYEEVGQLQLELTSKPHHMHGFPAFINFSKSQLENSIFFHYSYAHFAKWRKIEEMLLK
jgi:hypothetical protein